jgi:hypothetical protein
MSDGNEVRSPTGRRKVSNIVCRTKYLDDLILRLTGSSPEQQALPPQLDQYLTNLERQLIENSGRALTGAPKHVQQVRYKNCMHATLFIHSLVLNVMHDCSLSLLDSGMKMDFDREPHPSDVIRRGLFLVGADLS